MKKPRFLTAPVVTILATASSLTFSVHADASVCTRLRHETLSQCDVTPSAYGCPGMPRGAPTWEQVMQYRNYQYTDPGTGASELPQAKKACKKFYQKRKGGNGLVVYPALYEGPVEAVKLSSTSYGCFVDLNLPGEPGYGTIEGSAVMRTGEYNNVHSFVDLDASVIRDSCCDLTPTGPYAQVFAGEPPGTVGKSFTTTQKSDLQLANFDRITGAMRSDAGPRAVQLGKLASSLESTYPFLPFFGPLQGQPVDELFFNQTVWDQPTDPADVIAIYSPASPEVDHIIPRRDSNGCGCGTNSHANAMVISRELNQRMSNNCRHPDRLTILQAFAGLPI